MFKIRAASTMGHQFGICLLLSLLALATLGEDRLVLDVNKFNSTMLEMSCRSEGEKKHINFMILKDRKQCLNTHKSVCQLLPRNSDDCQFDCKRKKMTNPKAVSFLVQQNGSCAIKHTIRCVDIGKLLQPDYFVLTATSDAPVISINNGHQIQAGLEPVPIECTVANRCHPTQIDILGHEGLHIVTPFKISHSKHGRRFNTTAKTKAVFLSAGNYNITCKEEGQEDYYSTRLSVEVYDKGSKVTNGITSIEILFTIGMKLVTICFSLELSGGLQPSQGPNETMVLDFRKKDQFLTLTGEPNSCLSDILLCNRGITLSTEIKFINWDENAVFINNLGDDWNSYGFMVKCALSDLVFSVSTRTNVWTATVPVGEVPREQWMKMDISWSADIGLKIFFNNSLVRFIDGSVSRDLTATKLAKPASWTFGKMGEKASFSIEKIVFYFNGETEDLVKAGLLYIREPELRSDESHTIWIVAAVPYLIILMLVLKCVIRLKRQRRNHTRDEESLPDGSERELLPVGATSGRSNDRGCSLTTQRENPLARFFKIFKCQGRSSNDAGDEERYLEIKKMIRKRDFKSLQMLSEGSIPHPDEGPSIIYQLIECFQGTSDSEEVSILELIKKLTHGYKKSALSKKEDLSEIIWKRLKCISVDGESTEKNCIKQLKVFLPLGDGLSTRLLWQFAVHDEKSRGKMIENSHFVRVLEFLVKEGGDPFTPNCRTTAFSVILDECALYLQEPSSHSAIVSFCQTSMKWAASQTNESILNDVIKSVPHMILEESSCHISTIKEVIMKHCHDMMDQNPSLRDHVDKNGKTPLHNLMEKLLTGDAWQDMSKLSEGTDSLWGLMSELITTKNVNIKDWNNVTPYSWLAYWRETPWNVPSSKNLSTKMDNIFELMKDADRRDALQGLYYIREIQKKKNVLRLRNAFCGISIENDIVEKISSCIEKGENPRKIHKAELQKLSLLQDPNYMGYFAVVSSPSLNNGNFCVHLMTVLRQLALGTRNNKGTFVLVVVNEDAAAVLDDVQDKTINWPIDLKDIPRVDVHSQPDDDILNSILSKLQGPPLSRGVSPSSNNIGISLAWCTFQDYFAFMLPGITERITKSEAYQEYAGKMSKNYIIVIPESYEIALEMTKKGFPRSGTIVGYLDDGKEIERDACRPYHLWEVVMKITNSQGDNYYCCYKYIAVNATLAYLLDSGELNDDEVKKEYSLYTDTLTSILRDPIYCNFALILNSDDYSTLPDDLCDLIKTQNRQQPHPIDANPMNQVTRVGEGLAWKSYHRYIHYRLPGLAKAIKASNFYLQKEMPAKYFILLPYSCVTCYDVTDAEVECIEYAKMVKFVRIYKISAGQETYHACVKFSGDARTLNEMERGMLAALTEMQKAAELRIYFETLNYLFTRPSAPDCCRVAKLVYYDDNRYTGRKLSEILVDEIKECLREEQYEDS